MATCSILNIYLCHCIQTICLPLFQQSSLEKSSNRTNAEEEEQREEDHTAESAAVTGSFSIQFGYSNPYIYDQFSLQTTEQRINQIILLQVRTCSRNHKCDNNAFCFTVLFQKFPKNKLRQKVNKIKKVKLRTHKNVIYENWLTAQS